MKKYFKLLTFILISSNNSFCQNQWEWLNPKPSGYTGVGIHFISRDTGFIINNKEILLTTDSGETWGAIKKISSANDINFMKPFGFIVGNRGSVLKTSNNGMDWNMINIGTTQDLNTINIISIDTIIITSENKLFKSYDGGNLWQSINIPNNIVKKSFFVNSSTGHVACSSGRIMKTIDGGQNWYVTDSVNSFPSDFLALYFLNDNVGFASREHSNILKTTNGGESWATISNTSDAIYSYFFLDEQNGFIAGNGGVIFKTNNGGSSWDWAGFQLGRVDGSTINELYFIDDKIGFAVGMRGRILKTIDGGQTWNAYSATYNNINQITFTSDSIGYFLSDKLYKSIDFGKSWNTLSTGVSDVGYDFGQFFSQDTFIVVTNGFINEVLKSENGGITFENLFIYLHFRRATSIFFLNQSIGYISCKDGAFFNGMYRTLDGGDNWTWISSQILDQMYFINENIGFGLSYGNLCQTIDSGANWNMIYDTYGNLNDMHFLNDSIAYIAGEFNTVLKSTNGGTNWIELNTDYDHLRCVRFYNEKVGLACGDYGNIFKTFNGGITWEKEVILSVINSITITNNGSILLAGNNGVILKDTLLIPLYTNNNTFENKNDVTIYPNPTNEYLTIKSSDKIKKVEIMDINGRILLSKNNHSSLDISEYIDGIYIIRIYTGNKIIIKSFIKINNN